MYVTRRMGSLMKSPEVLHEPPPDGPNSGYLVLRDDEHIAPTTCFGLLKSYYSVPTNSPFPQNRSFRMNCDVPDGTLYYHSLLIPVINQPLSSNQYYVIRLFGDRHRGEAFTGSKKVIRSKIGCYHIHLVKEKETRELDPNDKDQQFEFYTHDTTSNGCPVFRVKSVAANRYPPLMLRQAYGMKISMKESKLLSNLSDAGGVNSVLRASLPSFDFPPAEKCSEVVEVGKWYTPFMFVKEKTPRKQVETSVYYEVTLEQRWVRIFYCENNGKKGNVVSFDVLYPTESVAINGKEAKECTQPRVGGILWLRAIDDKEEESKIGLSLLVVERMFWEQERVGWSNNKEKQVKLTAVEEYKGVGSWKKLGCYLLVERFLFKRMDGSIALSFDFNHTHHVKTKWDNGTTHL